MKKLLSKIEIRYLFYLYIFTAFFLHVIPTGSIPLDDYDIGELRLDYLLHTLIFLPWMVLVRLQTINESQDLHIRKIVLWLTAGLVFAAFCESIQILIPFRSFNPLDLIFNLSGILLGLLFFIVPKSMIMESRIFTTLVSPNHGNRD